MTTGCVRCAAVAALTAALVAAGCGKKGAPLPPLVRIPAAVDTIAAARFGSRVYVTLTVPTTNIDESLPIDIARVEVYGYTGRVAPPVARWPELGTLVSTIPVEPLPAGEPGAPRPSTKPGADKALPGDAVTILDPLDQNDLAQGPVPVIDPSRPGLVPPSVAATTPAVLRRFYVAIPFSQRGRPGPPGKQAELVLTRLPDPPADLRVSYGPGSVLLSWEPSGGLLGFLLDRPLPQEPLPFDALPPAGPATPQAQDDSVPPGPTTYQIYREPLPDPLVLPPSAPQPSWSAVAPVPLNSEPVSVTSASDSVEFGRGRCYTIRARRGAVLSEPSEPACVTPVDVFPPGSPSGLAAVPSEGGISLIWEPNTEPDLGGYLVLRSEPGDATLRQLTGTPIGDARYRDTTVQPGTRYTYFVVAVDRQLPLPNVSVPSQPVDEVAR